MEKKVGKTKNIVCKEEGERLLNKNNPFKKQDEIKIRSLKVD